MWPELRQGYGGHFFGAHSCTTRNSSPRGPSTASEIQALRVLSGSGYTFQVPQSVSLL